MVFIDEGILSVSLTINKFMATNKKAKIQITRGAHIEISRDIAYLNLTRNHRFSKGEIVMMQYYKQPDVRTDVSVLMAIGVGEGTGEEFFRIIEAGAQVPVRKVAIGNENLPDTSLLEHGEIYVWYGDADLRDDEEEFAWYYVDRPETSRRIRRITEGPFIFLDLETGYRWFYKDQECKREDDFFTVETIEAMMQLLIDSKPTITVKASNNSSLLFEVGDVKNITLDINVKDVLGKDITSKCLYFYDGEEIFLDRNGRYTVTNINKDTTIKIEARQPITKNVFVPVTGQVAVKFGHFFYFGRVPGNWHPADGGEISRLEYKKLHYKADFTWERIKLTGQKIAFAYPKLYGDLSHIFDDHGLDYLRTYDHYEENYFINDIEYTVYIKKDVVDIDGLKQKFVFIEPDELDLESATMLDIITAWKIRNTTSGFVQLDENGKIPEGLYNLNAASSFIPLAGIVDDYPESDMVRDELYYVTSTGKLYKATSDTQGSIEDVNPGFIYTYQNNFYTWTGLSLRPFGRLLTRDIEDITEIF